MTVALTDIWCRSNSFSHMKNSIHKLLSQFLDLKEALALRLCFRKLQPQNKSSKTVILVDQILELTSDIWEVEIEAQPQHVFVYWDSLCWLLISHMWSSCGIAEVETRAKSERPQHWPGFPPRSATNGSFKSHSFQGNRSIIGRSYSLCVVSHTCTA